MNKPREMCFGYRHDGISGCRWLVKKPSETTCARCSFFKTQKEFYEDQNRSEMKFSDLKVKVSDEGNFVHLINNDDEI